MADTIIAPAELTEEQRIAQRNARWAELRSRPLRSAIYARCRDKSVYVKWVRKDDPNDISFHEGMGFKIVRESAPKAPKDKMRFDCATPCNADGHYVNGDVILMEIRRDDYDFYVNEGLELSSLQKDSGKQRFKQDGRKSGVTVFETNTE